MLAAVTFDLWQTLIADTPDGLRRARAGRVEGIHRILQNRGHRRTVTAVDQAYEAVGERLDEIWKTHRDIGSREQMRLLLDRLDLGPSVAADTPLMDVLERAYCLPILSAMPAATAGAAEVLAALSTRGVRIGLICNTGRTPGTMLRIVLDRLGLAPYLSTLTFSDEVGLRKPHPEIFRRTLAALGAAAEASAHVGDDLATDVAGARGYGMRAIHLCHERGASPISDDPGAIASLADLLPALFPEG